MAAAQPNPRASLLANLRTGGVRSVSIPHTASPGGVFNVPRIPSASITSNHHFFPEEQEIDHLSDMMSHANFVHDHHQPRTAAIDPHGSRLSQHQQELLMQRQLSAQRGAVPMATPSAVDMHSQAQLQLQMMQMEIMRLHALAQMQQFGQVQQPDPYARRGSEYGATNYASQTPVAQVGGASPLAQLRARQMEQTHGYSGVDPYTGVPMTAALGGKFGGRTPSTAEASPLSRGTPIAVAPSATPSKGDSASTWRRGVSSGNSVLSRGSSVSPGKASGISSETSSERSSPPPLVKGRPEPLTLRRDISPARKGSVAPLDDSEAADDSSSSKSDTDQNSSSPTTPVSSHSNSSTREEASKKLFQGLGLGRPAIHVTAPSEGQIVVPIRVTSQPIRQPRGPPAAVDELGDKNFANRIRKKAIGGLGALLEAREKRDVGADTEAQ